MTHKISEPCYRPDEDYETIKAGFLDLYHNHPKLYDVFAKKPAKCWFFANAQNLKILG